jgi:hypothetical protein
MRGYSKDCVVPSITVHYNGFVQASMQGFERAVLGHQYRSNIMDKWRPPCKAILREVWGT